MNQCHRLPSNEPGTDKNHFINHNKQSLHICTFAHWHMHSAIHKQYKLHEQKNVNITSDFKWRQTQQGGKNCHGNVLNNRTQGPKRTKTYSIQFNMSNK